MLRFHCKNWSCEDNEADAKSFFRVEIFFFQSDGHRTHCWKNGCSCDQRRFNFFCPEVVKSEFDLQNLGCKSCLRCESTSKAGLYFVRSRLLGGRLYKQGNFFLKVDERESGELFEELFWNDVAYFFPMNINFCNLIFFERSRNGNDIFLSSKLLPKSKYPSFSTLLFRDGGNIVGFFWNFLFFRSWSCVNWTDRSLSSFSEKKKCGFKSMLRFAVVEFEDIDVTFS